ncbi:hypothetical protein BN6_55695 [Saccharothrix espanaensis DSM 44229]|uniref:Transposase n=1 Tax=Saccharothrix espanaensis (strain ATCC 51144 / DSM 44229 / JCM 9112 / NBRC 15066 / NRRL 15764) TaxID=1179773 RepID=K0K7G2_SACES|nr:hypothetical protein BN6_55695 [Saccharothrix espanaensis DSM 44229]
MPAPGVHSWHDHRNDRHAARPAIRAVAGGRRRPPATRTRGPEGGGSPPDPLHRCARPPPDTGRRASRTTSPPVRSPARRRRKISPERLRRDRKWSARRIALELDAEGTTISVRTVGRHLVHLGLNRRRFLDPTGLP